jgi:NADP-dependent 3-hydroxy acid dehydrogenase YdfG
MNANIKDKVIAITGASSGIGEAIARHLAAQGAKVALGARRQGHLDKIVGEIVAAGGQAFALAVDVTKRDAVEAFAEATVKRYGRLDVFINNAGLMPLSPLAANKVDEWERMVDVNVKGVLYGIAAALPRFQTQKSGHLINISSVAGHVVFPGGAVYCGTKFAVRAIAEGLRQESGPTIRSTIISPGAVKSELIDHITDVGTAETIKPLAETAIEADAIARAVAFAIEQPADVDVNEIIVRPTVQTL